MEWCRMFYGGVVDRYSVFNFYISLNTSPSFYVVLNLHDFFIFDLQRYLPRKTGDCFITFYTL